jgi:hypothetical protein
VDYKCPQVTTRMIDPQTKEEISVTTGPYRDHLFNSGVVDKKDRKCMRCGTSWKH